MISSPKAQGRAAWRTAGIPGSTVAKLKRRPGGSTAPQRAGPRKGRSEATVEAILRAAEQMFAERGFKGASTRRIAARARVNKGLIFYHFGDKQKLFAAVIDNFFSYLRIRIKEFLRQGGDEFAVMRQAVDFTVDFTAEHASLAAIIHREIIDRGHYHRSLLRRHLIPIMKIGIEFIEQGIRAGRFRRVDPVRFVYSIIGVNLFYFTAGPVLEGLLRRPDPLGPVALAEQKREMWELVRRGLAAEER